MFCSALFSYQNNHTNVSFLLPHYSSFSLFNTKSLFHTHLSYFQTNLLLIILTLQHPIPFIEQ